MAEEFMDVSKYQKQIYLSPEELHSVKYNPGGLTKEGVLRKIHNWSKSQNKQLQGMYVMMLKRCKNYANSGKLKDGRTILSREVFKNPSDEDDITFGNAKWAEWVKTGKVTMNWINEKPIEILESYKSQSDYDEAPVDEKL